MDEYINKGLALEAKMPHYSANGVEIIVSEAIPVEYIEKLPAADVRPVVYGHWIPQKCCTWIGVDIDQPFSKPREFFAYYCSCCDFNTGEIAKNWNFCPNCGADMREQPKEEQI